MLERIIVLWVSSISVSQLLLIRCADEYVDIPYVYCNSVFDRIYIYMYMYIFV